MFCSVPVLLNITRHELTDIFQVMTWREYSVKSHLFEFFFDISKVMFANHQIAANIKWNFSDTTFDAALTKPQAVNITMTINRGNHNGIGTRFYRCVNIFILTHHYAKVNDIKVMRGENSIQNFI